MLMYQFRPRRLVKNAWATALMIWQIVTSSWIQVLNVDCVASRTDIDVGFLCDWGQTRSLRDFVVSVVTKFRSCIIHFPTDFLKSICSWSWILTYLDSYLKKMFLSEIRQLWLETWSLLLEHRFVGIVIPRSRNEAKYLGILQRSSKGHFLHYLTGIRPCRFRSWIPYARLFWTPSQVHRFRSEECACPVGFRYLFLRIQRKSSDYFEYLGSHRCSHIFNKERTTILFECFWTGRSWGTKIFV